MCRSTIPHSKYMLWCCRPFRGYKHFGFSTHWNPGRYFVFVFVFCFFCLFFVLLFSNFTYKYLTVWLAEGCQFGPNPSKVICRSPMTKTGKICIFRESKCLFWGVKMLKVAKKNILLQIPQRSSGGVQWPKCAFVVVQNWQKTVTKIQRTVLLEMCRPKMTKTAPKLKKYLLSQMHPKVIWRCLITKIWFFVG